MTLHELQVIRDVLNWAEAQVKTDTMYMNVQVAKAVIKRDIKLKTTDMVTGRTLLDVNGNEMNGE